MLLWSTSSTSRPKGGRSPSIDTRLVLHPPPRVCALVFVCLFVVHIFLTFFSTAPWIREQTRALFQAGGPGFSVFIFPRRG